MTTEYTTNNLNQYTSVGGVDLHLRRRRQPDLEATGPTVTTYSYDRCRTDLIARHRTGRHDSDLHLRRPRQSWSPATTTGDEVRYLIDPSGLGNVVGEYDGAGRPLARYDYGLGLVSQRRCSEAMAYYDFDAIGSTVGINRSSGRYIRSIRLPPVRRVSSPRSQRIRRIPIPFVGEIGVAAKQSRLELHAGQVLLA